MNQLLELDFIKSSPLSIKRWTWLGSLVLLSSFLVAWITWRDYQENLAIYTDNKNKVNHLVKQVEIRKQSDDAKVMVLPPSQIKQVAEISQSLAIPWEMFFLTIEKSSLPDVALLNLEPNPEKKQVTIVGEAKDLHTILDYINQLEKQPILNQVYLQKHSVNQETTSKPITFTILASWELGD